MLAWKLTRWPGGDKRQASDSLISPTYEGLTPEIELWDETQDANDLYVISRVEMTLDDIHALPEFEGLG